MRPIYSLEAKNMTIFTDLPESCPACMYDHVGFIAELFGQIKMQLLMRTGQCLRKALQHRYNRLCLHNNKSLAKLRFLRISICNPRRHLKTCTSRESMEVRSANFNNFKFCIYMYMYCGSGLFMSSGSLEHCIIFISVQYYWHNYVPVSDREPQRLVLFFHARPEHRQTTTLTTTKLVA